MQLLDSFGSTEDSMAELITTKFAAHIPIMVQITTSIKLRAVGFGRTTQQQSAIAK